MVVKVIHAFSRCSDSVSTGWRVGIRGIHSHSLRTHFYMVYCLIMGGLKTRGPGGLVNRGRTSCFPVISVRIVHKLRAFVWPEEPMVCGGVASFVLELAEGLTQGNGRLQNQ